MRNAASREDFRFIEVVRAASLEYLLRDCVLLLVASCYYVPYIFIFNAIPVTL